MKKIMMMAMVAVAATSAFAQDDLVKQAKKQLGSGNFDAAVQTITPALTSAATVDKAGAWNTLSEIYYQKFAKINEAAAKAQITHESYDTLGMWNSAVEAWAAALKCDEFDVQPNEKGKVKIKYRTASQTRYKTFGGSLVNAGQFLYNQKKNDEALRAWELYLGMKDTPIFADVKDFPQDPFYHQIAYYTGLLAYMGKDYVRAEKYAKLAAQNPEQAAEANEILLFAKKDNLKTKEDSLAYLETLKELHAKEPQEKRYYNLLKEYYAQPGRLDQLAQFAEDEIAKDANNADAWYLKGYSAMTNKKWDDATAAYSKAFEIDPTFVEAIFNKGVCVYTKAAELREQLSDKNGNMSNDNYNKVRTIVEEAKGYMEKARELDPTRERVDWAYPLYQVYYSLKDEAKASEMEQLLNNR